MTSRPDLLTDLFSLAGEVAIDGDAIRDNVFAPGYQGSEQEIALRLGMSRTPVHEALIRLQEKLYSPAISITSGRVPMITAAAA